MIDETRLAELVRLRLFAAGRTSRAKLRDSLYPFVERELSRDQWRERWDAIVADFAAAGEATIAPLALTDRGRARARETLALGDHARAPRWPAIASGHLRALSLGVTDARQTKRLTESKGLRTSILARALEVPGATTPTAIADALVWRELGFEEDGPLSLQRLRARVLARRVGGTVSELPFDSTVSVAAAAIAGARRKDTGALTQALVARWLALDVPRPQLGQPPAAPSTPTGYGHTARGAARGEEPSLSAFAAAVLEVARAPSTRRFGPNKAFLSAVRTALPSTHAGPTRESFDARLLAAHRAGLLVLGRADLVQAMDPADVASSATHDGHAVYHFVRLDSGGAA